MIMELYKESLLNKIEDDLTGRNQNWDEIETRLAEDAKGTMTRIILSISANSGDGVVSYILGEEYVQSVVSSTYGIDINLKNIQNDAKVSSNFVITSGEGISIGGSGINPFIFQRTVSYTKLQLGIKTSPSSSHYPWNTIPSGTIRVTIAW
jgi:hypothetical protein